MRLFSFTLPAHLIKTRPSPSVEGSPNSRCSPRSTLPSHQPWLFKPTFSLVRPHGPSLRWTNTPLVSNPVEVNGKISIPSHALPVVTLLTSPTRVSSYPCFRLTGRTCFVETNLSYTDQYGEYHEINTDPSACNAYFCQPPNYDLLVDCLDCIIANGNQRPLGYHTNSALGASAAIPSEYEGYGIEYSPQGFVDATLANGWLKNVTNSCSKAGKPLGNVQSSLTATPTTTYVPHSSFVLTCILYSF